MRMDQANVGAGDTPRQRGRPVATDPDEVALVALTLFLERGFDACSMADVASAAQVSRRTLFRYFPSKNDLVWGGTNEAIDRMRSGLAESPADEPAIEAIRRMYVGVLTFPAHLVEVTRRRLLLIRAHPGLRTWGVGRTEPAIDLVARFLADRTHADPRDLAPQVAAHALSAAMNAALYWWAEFGDGEPHTVVDQVIDQIARGLID
jgi:AcrR family transcriptional regulator